MNIVEATRAARERTGIPRLAVAVDKGRFRLVAVAYNAKGKSTVTALTGYMAYSVAAVVEALGSVQPETAIAPR